MCFWIEINMYLSLYYKLIKNVIFLLQAVLILSFEFCLLIFLRYFKYENIMKLSKILYLPTYYLWS